MPIGVLINSLMALLGGLLGGKMQKSLPEHLKETLPVIFGLCAMGIGINSVIKAQSMTAVVLAVLAGYTIGQMLHLEHYTRVFFTWLVRTLHLGGDGVDMGTYITVVALFCCSGFGWYGALTEGIVGDSSILFSKSVLDLFTAVVFAASLGYAVCAIALPQCAIMLVIFGVGRALAPFLTPAMFADLSACGGILTLAASLRVARIKDIAVINLMPALILVMPLSALWTMVMG